MICMKNLNEFVEGYTPRKLNDVCGYTFHTQETAIRLFRMHMSKHGTSESAYVASHSTTDVRTGRCRYTIDWVIGMLKDPELNEHDRIYS